MIHAGLVDTEIEEPLDDMPYTTIIYGNGPGGLSEREELLTVDTSKTTKSTKSTISSA